MLTVAVELNRIFIILFFGVSVALLYGSADSPIQLHMNTGDVKKSQEFCGTVRGPVVDHDEIHFAFPFSVEFPYCCYRLNDGLLLVVGRNNQ